MREYKYQKNMLQNLCGKTSFKASIFTDLQYRCPCFTRINNFSQTKAQRIGRAFTIKITVLNAFQILRVFCITADLIEALSSTDLDIVDLCL